MVSFLFGKNNNIEFNASIGPNVEDRKSHQHNVNKNNVLSPQSAGLNDVCFRGVRFGPKVGHIGSKWDKYSTFSDQISVHFGSRSQNVLKSDLKKVIVVPFEVNLTYFVSLLWTLFCSFFFKRVYKTW